MVQSEDPLNKCGDCRWHFAMHYIYDGGPVKHCLAMPTLQVLYITTHEDDECRIGKFSSKEFKKPMHTIEKPA